MTKFIFVTGGVLSGLGKGVTAASVANILKARGYSVFMQKLDQYLNIDAGTLNPGQHGEVFVTDDGTETDLDLGHYERFIDINLTKYSYVTTGSIYTKVLENERKGKYLGKTIQVIPHVIDEVKRVIKLASRQGDVEILISEIGGTVGDMEGLHFLEAARQMKRELPSGDVLFIHVSYLPQLGATKDLKTKPTQHSVRELRALGLHPDIIACRAEHSIGKEEVEKIALFCDVDKKYVVKMETASNIYEIPILLEKQNLGNAISQKMGLPPTTPNFTDWQRMLKRARSAKEKVTIGMVCKYMLIDDAYLSVFEALDAAGWQHGKKVKVEWIDAEELETYLDVGTLLDKMDGILVPGGFGTRGIEGKMQAIRYARETNIPYLGLCLGMQLAVVEFARNVCGLSKANSTEFDRETTHPVIDIMPEQKGNMQEENYGATMRLGAYPCILKEGTKAYDAYGQEKVQDRHRHRYEVNPAYTTSLEEHGLIIAGMSPNRKLVEVVELRDHPWFVATQAHPELTSRPNRPHPLFSAFVKAAGKH